MLRGPLLRIADTIVPDAYGLRVKARRIIIAADTHQGNRVFFSIFAIALLWLSSLSVATALATTVIGAPNR